MESKIETCKNGHVRTEDNTRWHKDSSRNRTRKRCLDCKNSGKINSQGNPKGGPNPKDMMRQATDFLHEDIEDLLKFGATYNEIIERSGYCDWNTMMKSLKRRGRTDLLDAMKAKKVQV